MIGNMGMIAKLQCVIFMILVPINICALIFGFREYSCTDSNGLIDIPSYLKLSGFIMLSFNFALCPLVESCWLAVLYFCSTSKWRECCEISVTSTLCLTIMMIFELIWAIIGFLIYVNLNNECKISPHGKMLLSWSVINISLLLICNAPVLWLKCQALPDKMYEMVPQTFNVVISEEEEEILMEEDEDVPL